MLLAVVRLFWIDLVFVVWALVFLVRALLFDENWGMSIRSGLAVTVAVVAVAAVVSAAGGSMSRL